MGSTSAPPGDSPSSPGAGPRPGASSVEAEAETHAQAQADATAATEGLGDAAKRLYVEGEAAARGLLRTLDALRSLAGHDAALARAALPQAVLVAGIGVALGLAGWLFLMALLVVMLQAWLGLLPALILATVLSTGGAAVCAWRCLVLMRMTRFQATRRQLRRFKRVLRPPNGDPPASDNPVPATAPPAEPRR